MGWLENKVTVITGGGSGLGAAITRRFVREGASVAVLEIMDHKVENLRAELGEAVLVIQGDVTKIDDQQRFRDEVIKRFGRVDALVGVQGIWDYNVRTADLPLESLDRAFHEMFDVNVKGYLLSARIFSDDLIASNGSIVLTLSNASYSPDGGGPLYTASKHAALGLVRQLAFELAPDVRVNGVAPCGIKGSDLRGPTSLGMQDQSHADIPPQEMEKSIVDLLPLRHFATADEYTSFYVLLASKDHSGVMTGQVIRADQGLDVRPILSAGTQPTSKHEGPKPQGADLR